MTLASVTPPADDPLGSYAGRRVISTSLRITKAGDGLSDGMSIEPDLLEPGQTYYVVLPIVPTKHVHKLDSEIGMYRLEQVCEAQAGATFVSQDLVAEVVEKQKARIQAWRDEQEGKRKLFATPVELVAEHDLGQHADGLRAGCPSCQAEIDASAEEAGEVAKAKTKRTRKLKAVEAPAAPTDADGFADPGDAGYPEDDTSE